MNAEPRYRCLAVNDEQSTCCCCGKKGLKRVVWLLDNENLDAEPAHYGTTCAAHLLMGRLAGEPKPKISAAETAIAAALDLERTRTSLELLAVIKALPVPVVIEADNKYGVAGLLVGETHTPWSFVSYNCRIPLADMTRRAQLEWTLDQVSTLARERGIQDTWRIRSRATELLAA